MQKDQIIDLLIDLYLKIPSGKDFLNVFVSYDVEKLIVKYKKEITKLILPNSYTAIFKEVEARKLIRTIRKMSIDKLSIEEELHYVECCLHYIKSYIYWDERYYIALEKMFYEAENKILKNGWENEYEDRLVTIID